jgi:hypothetical protein
VPDMQKHMFLRPYKNLQEFSSIDQNLQILGPSNLVPWVP